MTAVLCDLCDVDPAHFTLLLARTCAHVPDSLSACVTCWDDVSTVIGDTPCTACGQERLVASAVVVDVTADEGPVPA